jgi:hypothetical protein
MLRIRDDSGIDTAGLVAAIHSSPIDPDSA